MCIGKTLLIYISSFLDKKPVGRKLSQPHFGPLSITKHNVNQKAPKMIGTSRTPDHGKNFRLKKHLSANIIEREFIIISLI